jgi:hypothetical protein
VSPAEGESSPGGRADGDHRRRRRPHVLTSRPRTSSSRVESYEQVDRDISARCSHQGLVPAVVSRSRFSSGCRDLDVPIYWDSATRGTTAVMWGVYIISFVFWSVSDTRAR